MTSADGFFFDFGAPTTATTEVNAPFFGGGPSPVADTISLSTFPWVRLDGPERDAWLAEWGARYPQSTATATATQWLPEGVPATKPLHLSLGPASTVKVCYQTAPELAVLTHARADEECGDSGSPPSRPCDNKREARDIVKGKYYGGLKVWSCAPDLSQYLAEHSSEFTQLFAGPSSGPASASPVVAEVGCGQGIPGLTALALGARRVIFMDYNEEVLDACTRPNVAATVHAAQDPAQAPSAVRLVPQVQFVAGDWQQLEWDTAVAPGGCDVVLGTDVTFDDETCAKLAQLLQRWLKPKTGTAYIASKVYYFGTGGGAEALTTLCARGGLQTDVVKRMEADGGMHRVILRVRKP